MAVMQPRKIYADMMEQADIQDLESCEVTREGSNPFIRIDALVAE